MEYIAINCQEQATAGWCSWLSRIVNTDKVLGSSPSLVSFFWFLLLILGVITVVSVNSDITNRSKDITPTPRSLQNANPRTISQIIRQNQMTQNNPSHDFSKNQSSHFSKSNPKRMKKKDIAWRHKSRSTSGQVSRTVNMRHDNNTSKLITLVVHARLITDEIRDDAQRKPNEEKESVKTITEVDWPKRC